MILVALICVAHANTPRRRRNPWADGARENLEQIIKTIKGVGAGSWADDNVQNQPAMNFQTAQRVQAGGSVTQGRLRDPFESTQCRNMRQHSNLFSP